jgi:hypothetical protein
MHPSNMIFVTVATAVVVGIIYWLLVQNAIRLSSINHRPFWQAITAFVLVGGFALALVIALSGQYSTALNNQASVIALPLTWLVGSFLVGMFITDFRRIAAAIPSHWLIITHVLRILPGTVFVAMQDVRLLPTDMALQAGYGDIIAGLAALPVAYVLFYRLPYARTALLAWNIFGLLDLINALYLGLTTIPAWMGMLSGQQDISFINLFMMLPTYSVPLFIISHLLLFREWLKIATTPTFAYVVDQ